MNIQELDFQSAKCREDYRFFCMREDIRDEIIAGHMDRVTDYGVLIGEAVLEIGNIDIEINISTPEQEDADKEGDDSPCIDYFCCAFDGEEWWEDGYLLDHFLSDNCKVDVDWAADNWRELLERDMFDTLVWYANMRGLSFDEPNEEEHE